MGDWGVYVQEGWELQDLSFRFGEGLQLVGIFLLPFKREKGFGQSRIRITTPAFDEIQIYSDPGISNKI